MAEENKLNRRSFLGTVAGAAAGGVALASFAGRAGAQQRQTGRSDQDSGSNADRAGYGRTGRNDQDPYDMPGRGVGGGGRPAQATGNGRTDRDPTDRPGRGYSGRSDQDSGANSDRAGHGR